ncbi:MAG: TolC family protein [Bacteroidota bacterium]
MKTQYKLLLFLLIMAGLSRAQTEEDYQWTIQECVDYALENNLSVQRTLLNVETSDITYQQSKMALLPDANITGNYGFNWGRTIDPTTNLFVDNRRTATSNGSLIGTVPVFNGFNLRNTIKQNELAFQASQQDLERTKNDVIINIITFYTNVLFNKELLDNAKKQLNSTEQQVDRTAKQVEAGALPRANLLDLEAQYATNELNVVNAENNYKLTKIQLKQALQLPPSSSVDIVVPEINVEENMLDVSVTEVYEIALRNMPEIKSANLNQESASWGIKAAKSNLYPSLSFTGGLSSQYSDATADAERFIRDGGEPTIVQRPIGFVEGTSTRVLTEVEMPSGRTVEGYSFGDQVDDNLRRFIRLNVNIPIFNRFQTRAGIQRAIINQQQAEINLKDVQNQLWQTIEQSYYDVEAASKSYAASLKQVEARRESFRVTKQRYDNGAANFVDYQVAENDLFQSESDLVRAKYDYIFKLKILDFYQGKPLEF